jgi:PAS domain S-box-containing protein
MYDLNSEEEKKSEGQKETLKEKLKRKTFQIYLELMKERNISYPYAWILMGVMFLQLFGFIYYKETEFPFEDDLYITISDFLDLLRIYPAIETSKSSNNYFTFMFAMVAVLIFYVLQMLYIDYSIKIHKFYFNFPIKLQRAFNCTFYWLLLTPIVESFVSIFSCKDGYHIVARDLQCWTGIHIFYCFFFFIALLVFFIIIILMSYFYNESISSSIDVLARLDCNFEVYFAIYRIFIAILAHFARSSSLHWLLIVVYLFGSMNFVKMYFKYFPYYNNKISVLFGGGLVSYFWICFNLFIAKILENIDYSGQSIVILVGIIIILPLVKNIREKKIYQKVFDYRHDKIKSEYELDIYMNKLSNLSTDQQHNEVDEMILLGFVTNHKSECSEPNCPLNTTEELYLPASDSYSSADKSNIKDPIILLHLLKSIYDVYAKNSNSTAILHTTFSNFLFYQMNNIHRALLELNVAEKCETSLQQKFTIYRSKRIIERYLVKKYRKSKEGAKQTIENLDVTIVITFENLFAKLQKAIEKSASEHIEFWSHLDSILPDLNILHKIGLNIIIYSRDTHDLWNKLIKINANYSKALHIYGYYLSEIKNDQGEGNEYVEKGRCINMSKNEDENMNDFELMFAEDTAIIVMSGNKEIQGKISKTNSGITKLFGYNTFEVYGHDVNILMPPIIGQKHQFFLEKYFLTGKERILNSETHLFAMHRSGYVFSISSIVKPVPSLQNDIEYISLIRPINRNSDYILTDCQGKIDSITAGISSMLNVSPGFFKENEVYIQIICPDLFDLVDGQKTTKFEIIQGRKKLTFIIPKNFSNLTQTFSKNTKVTKEEKKEVFSDDSDFAEKIEEESGDDENEVKSRSNSPDLGSSGQESRGKRRGSFGKRDKIKAKGSVASLKPKKKSNDSKLEDIEEIEEAEIELRQKKKKKRNKTPESPLLTEGSGGRVTRFKKKQRSKIISQSSTKKAIGSKKTGAIVKKIRSMLKGMDSIGKGNHNFLKQGINYDDYETKVTVVCDVFEQVFSDGDLSIKVFKIAHQKKMERSIESSINENYGFDPFPKQTKAPAETYDRLKNLGLEVNKINTKMVQMRQSSFENKNSFDIDFEDGISSSQELPERTQSKKDGQTTLQKIISFNDEEIMKPTGNCINIIKSYPIVVGEEKGEKIIKEEPLDLSLARTPKKEDTSKVELYKINESGEYQDSDRVVKYYGGKGILKEKTDIMQESMTRSFDDPTNMSFDQLKGGIQGSRAFPSRSNPRKQSFAMDNPQSLNPLAGLATLGGLNPALQEIQDDKIELSQEEKEKQAQDFNADEAGSVASNTKSLLKHIRSLRNAMYEKYSPRSVRQLKFSAQTVFLVLIVITIVYFLIANTLYEDLKKNIRNLYYSRNRLENTAAIGASVRALVLLNQLNFVEDQPLLDLTLRQELYPFDYKKLGYDEREDVNYNLDYEEWTRINIETFAIELKKAQNSLATSSFDFSSENSDKINPSDVTVIYNEIEGIPSEFQIDCWSAIMGVVIHAYKIKDKPVDECVETEPSITYTLVNSFNNILQKIENSTPAILDESNIAASNQRRFLMILLIVASCALFCSVCVIFPVVTKVKKNKEELLCLFLEIPVRSVKEQLGKCRQFFNMIRGESERQPAGEQQLELDGENDENDENEEKEGEEKNENEEEEKKGETGALLEGEGSEFHRKHSSKKRKFKQYSTQSIFLILKLLFFLSILEGYFLLSYFKSDAFLTQALFMIDEIGIITTRASSNGFLYRIEQEMVGTNGQGLILNQNAQTYVQNMITLLIEEQEDFLKTHSKNIDFNDDSYNSFFDSLVYQDMCSQLFIHLTDITECEEFMGGILSRGLHSANVAYWDNLREFNNDFNKIPLEERDFEFLHEVINDLRMIENEILQFRYFTASYNKLLEMLDQSIDRKFSSENSFILIIFIAFLIILCFLYFFIWNLFVESTRRSLWVTKSMLAIIPVEIILTVNKIREFLVNSSKSVIVGLKGD